MYRQQNCPWSSSGRDRHRSRGKSVPLGRRTLLGRYLRGMGRRRQQAAAGAGRRRRRRAGERRSRRPDIEGRSFNLIDAPLSDGAISRRIQSLTGYPLRVFPTRIAHFYRPTSSNGWSRWRSGHPDRIRIPSYADWESRTQKAVFNCDRTRAELGLDAASDRRAHDRRRNRASRWSPGWRRSNERRAPTVCGARSRDIVGVRRRNWPARPFMKRASRSPTIVRCRVAATKQNIENNPMHSSRRRPRPAVQTLDLSGKSAAPSPVSRNSLDERMRNHNYASRQTPPAISPRDARAHAFARASSNISALASQDFRPPSQMRWRIMFSRLHWSARIHSMPLANPPTSSTSTSMPFHFDLTACTGHPVLVATTGVRFVADGGGYLGFGAGGASPHPIRVVGTASD